MVDYPQSREFVGQMYKNWYCVVCSGLQYRRSPTLISNNLSPPEETPAAVAGGEARKNSTDELEAELEMDLDNLKLDDIDTTDVNLDDEDLLED